MHIEGPEGVALPHVTVMLSRAEARELQDTLSDLLAADDPARHHHVMSEDDQTELTISVGHV